MHDLRAIFTWLLDELRALLGFVREPPIWLALVSGLILWTLAYQVPYVYQLDLGGSLVSSRRYDDEPFLGNFNDPEPDPIPVDATMLYRWSKDDSTVVFPGIGGGHWLARIRAGTGSRPEPVAGQWDDGTRTYQLAISKAQRDYQIVAAADSAGDLTLHFVTPPLTPPGDPRILGLVMSRIVIEAPSGARIPAPRQLALLALSLALIYALLRRFALAPRAALLVALALAALGALLLVRERMALTLLTPVLPTILASCYALGILLHAFSNKTSYPVTPSPRHPVTLSRPPLIIALILLAVALRLGGVLHPHARFSDDGLNAHDLSGFTQGDVFFTEGLPAESGGGQAPYPPGQYIVFAPAQLVVPSDFVSLKRLLRVGNALWDSLAVGVVWYALRRGGAGRRAALFGAALYILPPPLLKSLSVGEFANAFGQALALPVLALLTTRMRELPRKPFPILLLTLLALALLGHLGVTISLFWLLACLALIWLIGAETRRAFRVLLGAGLLAGTLVGVFYYSALWDVLIGRLSNPPLAASASAALSIGQKLAQQAGYIDVYGIPTLALAVGLIGAALAVFQPLRWRISSPQSALNTLLLAWWGGTLLSLGLLLFASQSVRWYLFIYPALCLGGGLTLAGFWPRGRAGRLVATALLGFLLWHGLAFWIAQIADYLH